MSSFIDSMYGSFQVSEKQIRLRRIAKQYHDQCDAFDAKICSGLCSKTGDSMPVNQWELSQVNSYAYQLKQSMYKDNPDISPAEIRKAIQNY